LLILYYSRRNGMEIVNVVVEGLLNGGKSIFGISVIVFPLMIFMEIARDLNILDFVSNLFRPLTRFMGISENSAFPLAVGIIFGLAYGAGVIIQSAKDGDIDKKSLIILAIFLACCHAVFEDTLIFVAIGANGWVLLTLRLIAAFFLSVVISRKINLN